MLLLFSSLATTQLTFDPSCSNVVINKGTPQESQIDGSARIDNAFDIITQMGSYANGLLVDVAWGDPAPAPGNKQRVLELLSYLCLPRGHPHFREMYIALISEHQGITSHVYALISIISSIPKIQKSIKRQK